MVAQATTDHLLTWTPGAQSQAIIVRYRLTTQVAALLPLTHGQPPLAPGVGSYLDTDLLTESTYCYTLVAYQGSIASPQQQARSNLLCVLPGSNTGSQPPGRFRISLNDASSAALSWTAPGNQDRYVLTKTTFDTASPPSEGLAGDLTSFAEDIGTHATCYRLAAYSGSKELGSTETLCAVPGISSFGPLGPAGVGTAANSLR